MNTPTTAKPTAKTGDTSAKGTCSSGTAKKPAKKLSLEITEVEEVLERKISP